MGELYFSVRDIALKGAEITSVFSSSPVMISM